MTDLRTTDQTPDQHYSIWEPSRQGDRPAAYSDSSGRSDLQNASIRNVSKVKAFADRSMFNWVSFDQQQTLRPHAAPAMSAPPRSSLAMAQPSQVRKALAESMRSQRRTERNLKHQQAIQWLSENRKYYLGQWIALWGDTLLATGNTAKDVYSQVLGEQLPVLVIKVVAEDLPFGGW